MTKIEWTDDVWNPIVGCSRVSEGCRHCYAERMAARLRAMGTRGCQEVVGDDGRWTGKTVLVEEALGAPLRWRKPRRVFVNSMSDLFHESVPDEWIKKVFAIMTLGKHHTFQVLTKRPAQMLKFMHQLTPQRVAMMAEELFGEYAGIHAANTLDRDWPLPNVWLGVSVEDQGTADARIPLLLDTPAAVRFVSAEPLLGAVDLGPYLFTKPKGAICPECGEASNNPCDNWCRYKPLHWVIVGGESGPGARPMDADWVREIRDQCTSAGVPFFFKQWGEWAPGENVQRQRGWVKTAKWFCDQWAFGRENLAWEGGHYEDEPDLYRIGKREAGAWLDGREHKEWPK